MPQIIPLSAIPSQTLSVTLNNQGCNISVYQRNDWVFLDLYVGTQLIIGGVLCKNNVLIQQTPYLGFVGDLTFIDTLAGRGTPATDPVYTGLGSRYVLVYYTPAELAALQ